MYIRWFFVLKVLLNPSVYSVFAPNGHGEVSERRKTRSEASEKKETPEWQIELGITLNKQRKDRAMAAARRKQGLPVIRLRYKQSLPPVRSGRVVQYAVRADDTVSVSCCSVGTQTWISVPPSEDVVDLCCATPGIYAIECQGYGSISSERATSAPRARHERASSRHERASSACHKTNSAP